MLNARNAEPASTFLPPARERADELLLLACRRFCGEDGHDKLRPDQLRTAFYQLIDAVDDHCKREMADLLSDRPDTPRPIAHYLALEPVAVGATMLRRSPVLGQLDLMRIAHSGGEAHRIEIAKRTDLGTALQRQLGVVSQKTEQAPARDKLLAAAARKTTLAPVRPHHAEAFADRLEQAAWRNEHGSMIALLRTELGLDRATAQTVIHDKSGDTLAVALKAVDVAAAQAHRIAMYAFPQIGLDVSNSLRALSLYDRLTLDGCKQAVAQWPKDERGPSAQERRKASDGVRTIGGEQTHVAEARPVFGRRKRAG